MRKYILASFLFLFIAACMPVQTTEPEYALSLTRRYQAVHETYKRQYKHVDKKQQDFMRENIAPVLDRTKAMLFQYNKALISGKQDPKNKEKIIRLLREASTLLLGVEDE